MSRVFAGGLLSAVAAVGIASSANALSGPVLKSGDTYYRAACAPTVALAARCHAQVVTNASGHAQATDYPTLAGYTPAQLRDAYNVSRSGNSSTIIAIVDAYGYANAEKDLGVYRSQFNLTACTTANGCFKKLNQNGVQGNYPAQKLGWAQESALDLDMASAMCPGCKIYLIEAATNSFSNLTAAVNTAARLGAHAISNSYGVAEAGTQAYESAYNHPGIAITASSGDDGYGVEFPASSPHVTAVGGTHLVTASNSRGWTETVWSGAGSGCSAVYAKPSWQHDAGCSKRTVADVAAVADPNTGVAVYGPVTLTGSGWLVFGGTSAAAPLIAGIYGVNGASVNYGSNPYNHTSALFDVTSGSNGNCGGMYLCTGKVHYDGPSGLGTPNGSGAF
jgi:subtilase family serine protease